MTIRAIYCAALAGCRRSSRVEHRFCKPDVGSSILPAGSKQGSRKSKVPSPKPEVAGPKWLRPRAGGQGDEALSRWVVDFGGWTFDLALQLGGEVPERSKGADCKSAGSAFGGSNPPLTTSLKDESKVQSCRSKVNDGRPRLRTLDFGLWTSDFGLRTSDFGLRTSDFGLWTSSSGRSSRAEHRPSKPAMWVRFPSPAPSRKDLPGAWGPQGGQWWRC